MNIHPMTDVEKRSAAKTFVETWLGRGDEKQDAQNFGGSCYKQSTVWKALSRTSYSNTRSKKM